MKIKLFDGLRPQCSLEFSFTTQQLQLPSVENHLPTPICQGIWVRSKKAMGLCLRNQPFLWRVGHIYYWDLGSLVNFAWPLPSESFNGP